jgi:hypothetical protein
VTVLEQDETEVSAAIDGVNARLWTSTRFDALLSCQIDYGPRVQNESHGDRSKTSGASAMFRLPFSRRNMPNASTTSWLSGKVALMNFAGYLQLLRNAMLKVPATVGI